MRVHRKANLLRHIVVAFSDGIDGSDEFGWIAALGQIAIRACRKSGSNGTWLDVGGEDKNAQLRPFGSQLGYELKPAHARHAEIEDEKIGGTFVQQPVNGFTVAASPLAVSSSTVDRSCRSPQGGCRHQDPVFCVTLLRYFAGGFPSAFLNIVIKAVTDS
jgi:hypothetical protein